jgi:hypothetical protein
MIYLKATYIGAGKISGTSYIEVAGTLLLVPAGEVKALPKDDTPITKEKLEEKILPNELAVGVRVRHTQKPDWGTGTIRKYNKGHQDTDSPFHGECPWQVTWDKGNRTSFADNTWNCASVNLEVVDG